MTHPTDALRLVPRRAVYDWLRDDVPLNVKMTVMPHHIDALLDRLSKAAPASPLPGGGLTDAVETEDWQPIPFSSAHIGKATTMIDLDALEKLADEATPGPWKAVGTIYEHMNCEVRGGKKGEGQAVAQVWDGPHAFKDGQWIAAANPATIKALIAELKAALTMAHTINRVLSPQADRTFDLLISQSQWAVDTCCAFLARNGKGEG